MGVCTQGFGHKNSEARLFWMVSWALYREKKKKPVDMATWPPKIQMEIHCFLYKK